MSEHKNVPYEPLTPEELLAWAENRTPKEEKKSLDDPFLDDAAEGVRMMENPESLPQLTADFNQKIRLAAGTRPKAKGNPFQLFSTQSLVAVAASICLLIVAAVLFKNVMMTDAEMATDQNTGVSTEKPALADQLESEKTEERKDLTPSDKETPALEKNSNSAHSTNKNLTTHTDQHTATANVKKNTSSLKIAEDIIEIAEEKADLEVVSDGTFVFDDAAEPALADTQREKAKKDEKKTVMPVNTEAFENTKNDAAGGAGMDELAIKQAKKGKIPKNKLKQSTSTSPRKNDKFYDKEEDLADKPRNSSDARNEQSEALKFSFSDTVTTFHITAKGTQLLVNNYTSLNLNTQQNEIYNLGIAHFNAKNYSMAHNLYEQVLKEVPTSKELHFQQGLTYMQEGKIRKAQKSFDQILQLQGLNQYKSSPQNLPNASYKGYDVAYLVDLLKSKKVKQARYYLKTFRKELDDRFYMEEH